MQKVLGALCDGCHLEWQTVSKAENGNGRRLFIVDPERGRQRAVDPRTMLALDARGYIMHPRDHPRRWVLTGLGLMDYKAELGAR